MLRGKLLQDKRRAFERADRDARRDAHRRHRDAQLGPAVPCRDEPVPLRCAPRVCRPRSVPACSAYRVPGRRDHPGSPTRAWGTRESAHGAVGEARAGPSRVLGRGSSEGPLTVLCADSHLYGLDWASASNDRSER